MNETILKQEEDEEEGISNVVPFARPATGGSGPPTGPNWLSDLEVNTVFVAYDKAEKGFTLLECQVIKKLPRAVKIFNTNFKFLWVPVKEFSQRFELVEILGKVLE